MTREELLTLPISQLVNYVLDYENTIQQQRLRIADLERELSDAQRDESDSDVAVAATDSGAADAKNIHRHRHGRKHRHWCKKLLRLIVPAPAPLAPYLLLAFALVISAACLAVLVVPYLQTIIHCARAARGCRSLGLVRYTRGPYSPHGN